MKTLLRFCIMGLLSGVVLAGCGGGGGGGTPASSGGGTAPGENSVAAAIRNSAPISSCPSGGISVDTGIDKNANGVLDPSEVTNTQYVCNGSSNGLSALVSVTTEAAGANCTNGGKKVSAGLDANANSILDTAEITSSNYICNGTNGTNGLKSLIAIVTESAGANCANGGKKITSGLDANANSVLDTGEITTTTYVCNGLNGNAAPVANAGSDQKVAGAGSAVTLTGSGSSDANGNPLTYVWSFTTKPVGSAAALSSSTAVGPTFTADKAGTYVLSLVVNDGTFNSVSDTVTVRAGTSVPDTGQTRWYSTAFGDDGDYTITPMSYTDNYDGTITDNVTGLTWAKCSMGQSGADCATGTAATYTWANAGTACGNLSLPGTGWRLPTDFELVTIVDYGRYIPAINTAYFPNTQSGYYWSSITYAGDATVAWYVSYGNGGTSYYGKTNANYVRCVRGQ